MPLSISVRRKTKLRLSRSSFATSSVAPVLRHRVLTTFHAEAEGIDPDAVVAHLLGAIAAPPERAAARLVGA